MPRMVDHDSSVYRPRGSEGPRVWHTRVRAAEQRVPSRVWSEGSPSYRALLGCGRCAISSPIPKSPRAFTSCAGGAGGARTATGSAALPGMTMARSLRRMSIRPRRESCAEAPGVAERSPAVATCCSHCCCRRCDRGVRAVNAAGSRPRLAVSESERGLPSPGRSTTVPGRPVSGGRGPSVPDVVAPPAGVNDVVGRGDASEAKVAVAAAEGSAAAVESAVVAVPAAASTPPGLRLRLRGGSLHGAPARADGFFELRVMARRGGLRPTRSDEASAGEEPPPPSAADLGAAADCDSDSGGAVEAPPSPAACSGARKRSWS